MPTGTTIPGAPLLGELVGGDPFNPAGPEFATWLNDKLLRTVAISVATLTEDTGAVLADNGGAFFLDGWTLSLDEAAILTDGWHVDVLGPGTIEPSSGEGDAVVLAAGAAARVMCDGAAVFILKGGGQIADLDDVAIATPADEDELVYDAGASKWINRPIGTWVPVSVVSNEATIDLADGDRFIIDLDDDCELQVPDSPRTKPFAIRIVCSGAGHTFTFAAGWLGQAPAVLSGNGDETILSGIILDTSPSVTAVVNLVKALPA